MTEPPLRKVVDRRSLQLSVDYLNACNTALSAQRYDAAIAACRAATEMWDGNHLAWYGWATAHMAKREWAQAQAAVEHAVALRPDQAMYQMYYGIAIYEAARQMAREEAQRAHKNPEEIILDPAAPRLSAAVAALVQATKLVPELWRAHYYLGCMLRDLRDAKHAAEQLTATIETNPSYRYSYIALIELYRRWGYHAQSLAVATAGTVRVPVADSADLWFEVAISHDAMRADGKAIEAFGKAIALRPDDARLKLYRGWLYVASGDLAAAKRDLTGVMNSADPKIDALRQRAQRLLAYIASGAPSHGNAAHACHAVKSCSVVSAPDDGSVADLTVRRDDRVRGRRHPLISPRCGHEHADSQDNDPDRRHRGSMTPDLGRKARSKKGIRSAEILIARTAWSRDRDPELVRYRALIEPMSAGTGAASLETHRETAGAVGRALRCLLAHR